jgi:TRAP-type C4-dicarboxylate transport system permease small subunit
MEGLMASAQIDNLLERAGVVCDRIVELLAVLAALVIIGLVGILCYEVLMRYAIHKPPAWVWEISECMTYLIAFLGAAWLLKKNGHVSVDILYTRLQPRTKALIGMATSAVGTIICLIITWSGIGITVDHFHAGIIIPGYLDIPKAPLLLFVPIGCFMLSIQFLRQTYAFLREWKTMAKK